MVPASSEHSPLTVCSRTPLSLAVCGIVRNHHITPRPGTLALKVEVPSQPPAFFLVRPEDMHVAQPFLYRVAMTVRVGVFSWTRPVALVVTLVAMQPGTSPGDFAYEACSAISEGRKVYVQTS